MDVEGDRQQELTNTSYTQERESMKRKGAQGIPAADGLTPAANDEFAELVKELRGVEESRMGWDPYEVWRTRVKTFLRKKVDTERDPLR
jgi:hypothetical protein